MPLTDYLESTETILQQTAERLRAYPDWQVLTFSGSSLQALYQRLNATQLPAVIVIYQGGRRQQHPRRRLSLQLLIATSHAQAETGAANARALLDESIARLDDFSYRDAIWQYQGDMPLDLGATNTLYLVSFDVLLP